MRVERNTAMRTYRNLSLGDPRARETFILVGKSAQGDIQDLDHKAVTEHALNLQKLVLEKLAPHKSELRPPVLQTVRDVAGMISEGHGGLLVMRHGIQYVEDPGRINLKGSARKSADMQLPHNMADPADVQSLAEAASFGMILKKISGDTNLPVQLISSPNIRAAEVAAVMGVPTGFNFSLDDRLRCINYPNGMPITVLDNILGPENNGALVWKEEIVDAIAGRGTFSITTANMRGLIAQFKEKPAITVLITHTPQTSAVDVEAGAIPTRMPELGFRVLTTHNTRKFKDNIFG